MLRRGRERTKHKGFSVKESKIDATDRLRREGRLEAFNLRRDEIRNELRDAGKKRQEARDKAWSRAIEEFSPLTDEPKTPVTERRLNWWWAMT